MIDLAWAAGPTRNSMTNGWRLLGRLQGDCRGDCNDRLSLPRCDPGRTGTARVARGPSRASLAGESTGIIINN